MRVIREFDPDIVNVHFPTSQIDPLRWVTAIPHRWKLVATAHNSDIRCLPTSNAAEMKGFIRFYGFVDSFTAVNKDLLEEAIGLFPCLRSKGHLIENGVSEEWFNFLPQSSAAKESVLFVGRLEHVKGIDILLEAWHQVYQEVRWKYLLLAGDGCEALTYRRRAHELGLSQNVLFLGRKTHTELVSCTEMPVSLSFHRGGKDFL